MKKYLLAIGLLCLFVLLAACQNRQESIDVPTVEMPGTAPVTVSQTTEEYTIDSTSGSTNISTNQINVVQTKPIPQQAQPKNSTEGSSTMNNAVGPNFSTVHAKPEKSIPEIEKNKEWMIRILSIPDNYASMNATRLYMYGVPMLKDTVITKRYESGGYVVQAVDDDGNSYSITVSKWGDFCNAAKIMENGETEVLFIW